LSTCQSSSETSKRAPIDKKKGFSYSTKHEEEEALQRQGHKVVDVAATTHIRKSELDFSSLDFSSEETGTPYAMLP
jgi:hypothetical protein